MRDIIIGDKDKGYIVYYGLKNATNSTNESVTVSANESVSKEAVSDVRSYLINSIYKSLKSLDLKKLMIRQHEKIELAITIQKEKVELNY